MKYVIRLEKYGFYNGYFSGKKPYQAVSLDEATTFSEMKSARRQLNRLNSRLLKGPDGCGTCTIEEKKES